MKRIFIRLWLVAVLLFIVAIAANQVIFWLVFSDDELSYLQRLIAGGHRIAAEQVLESEDRTATLSQLERAFGFDVAVLARGDIPADARAELDRGVVPSWVFDDTDEYYYTPIGAGAEVLRVGPHNAFPLPALWPRVLLLAAGAVLFGLAFWWILRPLRRSQRALTRTAEDIAAGSLAARVPTEDMAAAPAMATAFNHMAERVEQLIGNQREILSVASHELRTPIARLRIGIHLLAHLDEDDSDRQARIERADALDADLEELDELVEELLTYARMDAERSRDVAERVTLTERVARVIDKQSVLATGISIRAGARLAIAPALTAVPRLLERVLDNLCGNALRYADTAVEIDAWPSDEPGYIEIAVDDDGPGIPPDARERVLLPFLRLDDKSGHGMGLAIVERIVSSHGGQTLIEDSPLGGCRVRTRWPAAE